MKGLWIKTGLVLLALTGVAFSQSTMDFLGGGARAQGMGKAFYGVSDDITALTWNPAGLAKQEKPILGISYGLFDPRGSYKDFGINNVIDSSIDRYEQSGSFNNVSFFGFLAPLRIRGHQFVLSATYNRAFNEYQTANYYDQGEQVLSSNGVPYDTISYTNRIGGDYHAAPYVVSFGFGTRIYHNLDFGAALNVYTGTAVNHVNTDFVSPDYVPANLLGQSVVFQSQTRRTDTAKFGGVNMTVAAKYTAPNYSLGLVIKSGYKLSEKVNSMVENFTRYNGLIQAGLTDTLYIDNQLEKVEVPWMIGVGGGYRVKPLWLVSADVEYRPWSGHNILHRDSVIIRSGGDNLEKYSTRDPRWFNVLTMRAGTEYIMTTSTRLVPKLPFRCGIGYVPIPAPTYNLRDTLSTKSTSGFNLSAGTGIYWQQIHLDLAYTYSSFDLDSAYGQLKMRNHDFSVGFTGFF
jgi:long-subunit fatty acid transport protein